MINDHLTISLYVNILLFSSHSSIPKVFLFIFCKKLSNAYIFGFRSIFYHNTVRVLPLGAQYLGTQSSRVPKGNTQKNPKFLTLWVPNPKIPMEFRHKPNPTHTQNLVRVRVLPLGTRILGTQSPPYDLPSNQSSTLASWLLDMTFTQLNEYQNYIVHT